MRMRYVIARGAWMVALLLGLLAGHAHAAEPARVDDSRMLYLNLILADQDLTRDVNSIMAVWQFAADAGVTCVAIKVPAWWEAPDAVEHRMVKMAVSVCRMRDLDYTWGRNLWPKWLDEDHPANVKNLTSSAFYAAAIVQVRAEAALLGVPSSLDAEPYGAGWVRKNIKGIDLTIDQLWAARLAVREAARLAGRVDYVYPVDSGSDKRMQWLWRDLGRRWITEKSYRWRTMPDRPLTPPAGFGEWGGVDVWGIWVDADPERHRASFPNGPLPLSAQEALAITHPATFLYISLGSREEAGAPFRATLKALAEANRGR